MKSATTGTLSGCLIWVIVFFFLLTCLVPVAAGVGGLTSTLSEDFVVRTLEPYMCPKGSHAEILTYASTSIDDFGNEQPATGYEMQCVDANGEITRAPSPDYSFVWIGVLAVVGLILAAILAFLLAAPAGVIIARIFNRQKNGSTKQST